jgi:ring-1,2-phenylacetyl-CoA epoxidase subunit PaaD
VVITPAQLDTLVSRARTLAASVTDPEIPVITIEELGILRDVQAVPMTRGSGGSAEPHAARAYIIEITLTPTYSGCPAIDQIRDDILDEMDAENIPARVKTQLSPAWTTDWMSQAAKDKLREYGIAPPQCAAPASTAQTVQFAAKSRANSLINTATPGIFGSESVPCPRCASLDTTETSHFASTACKALYKCLSCMEPFDYFKPY